MTKSNISPCKRMVLSTSERTIRHTRKRSIRDYSSMISSMESRFGLSHRPAIERPCTGHGTAKGLGPLAQLQGYSLTNAHTND